MLAKLEYQSGNKVIHYHYGPVPCNGRIQGRYKKISFDDAITEV